MAHKAAAMKAVEHIAPVSTEWTVQSGWLPTLMEVIRKVASPNGEQNLKHSIPRLIAGGMHIPLVAVLTYDRNTKRFATSIGWGDDEYSLSAIEFPVFSRIAEWIAGKEGETVVSADLLREGDAWLREIVNHIGLRSLIGIKLGPRVVIGMDGEPRGFSQEEKDVFGAFSRMAGMAAEKVERGGRPRPIGGEIETKAVIEKVIETLNEIAWVVGSTVELEEVLVKIVDVIVKVTGGDSCLLYLYDGDKNELKLRASNSTDPRTMEHIRMKLGEGITGWVARERKAVAISAEAYRDPRFKFFNELPEDHYEAFLSAPMISQGKFVGVVNVQHKKAYKHSPHEIALFSAVVQQVGGVIENTRLHELLETRKLVERAKGLLMRDKGISEPEAFRLIQREAMNTRRSMRDIANAVIIAANIREH